MNPNTPSNASTKADGLSRAFIISIGIILAGLCASWVGFHNLQEQLGGQMPRSSIVLMVGTAFFAQGLTLLLFTLDKRQALKPKLAKVDDAGVSPVIGVILMVAITVVLAAVVWVMVSRLTGDGPEQAPAITFQQDDARHRLQVIQADPEALWADLTLTTSAGCTATKAVNPSQPPGGLITAGDLVMVSAAPGVSVCDLSIRHTPTNTLLGSWAWLY